MKGSENPFPHVKFAIQVADPASPPPADHVFIFRRDDGEFYVMNSLGAVEPFGGGAGGFGGGINVTQREPAVPNGVHTDGGWVQGAAELSSGEYQKILVAVAAGDIGLTAAPTVNPRIDLIGVDEAGNITTFAGTESATPVPPRIATAEVTPLYLVHRRVGETQILNEDNGSDGYLEDIRGAAALNPLVILSGSPLVRLGRQFTGLASKEGTASISFHETLGTTVEATGTDNDILLKPNLTDGKVKITAGVGIVVPSLAADPDAGDSEAGQVYFNTTSDTLRWHNGTAWGEFGGATSLSGLSDVDVTTTPPADGDVLTWDDANSEWVPAPPAAGGGGALSYQESVKTADTSLVSADTWTDLSDLSLTLGAGTWLILGNVHFTNTTTTLMHIGMRLVDSGVTTTYASSGKSEGGSASTSVNIPIHAVVVLGATTTVKLQGVTSAIVAIARAAMQNNGVGNNASRITAIKIA